MADKRGLFRGAAPMLVLGLLAKEPLHGYEIIRRLSLHSDHLFDMKEGTLYPILHALEEKGYVDADWEEHGGRKRRIYHITPAGNRWLVAEQAEWECMYSAVKTVLKGEAYGIT